MITKRGDTYYYSTEAMQGIVEARSLLAKAAGLLSMIGSISRAELNRRMKSLKDGHGETTDGAMIAEVLALLLGDLRVTHQAAKNAGDYLNLSFAPMVRSWMDAETDASALNHVHQFLFDWELEKPQDNTEKDVKKDVEVEDVEESVP